MPLEVPTLRLATSKGMAGEHLKRAPCSIGIFGRDVRHLSRNYRAKFPGVLAKRNGVFGCLVTGRAHDRRTQSCEHQLRCDRGGRERISRTQASSPPVTMLTWVSVKWTPVRPRKSEPQSTVTFPLT